MRKNPAKKQIWNNNKNEKKDAFFENDDYPVSPSAKIGLK